MSQVLLQNIKTRFVKDSYAVSKAYQRKNEVYELHGKTADAPGSTFSTEYANC